jgi:hypothetical protein
MATDTLTSSSAPWGPLQPYLQNQFQRAEDLYQTGGPQYYPENTVAQFGAATNQALNQYTNLANAGSPVVAPAQSQVADTLSGQYLSPTSNPYLQGMYDDAASAVTRNYQEAVAPGIASQFANSGRLGSGLYANAMDSSRDTLSRNLGGMAANLYGGAYNRERDRQMTALGHAPNTAKLGYYDAGQLLNVGELQDQKAQQNLTDQVQRYQFNQERPWDAAARYSGLLGGNYGQTSSQEQYVPSGLQQGLGIGLAGLGVLGGISDAGGISGLLEGLF